MLAAAERVVYFMKNKNKSLSLVICALLSALLVGCAMVAGNSEEAIAAVESTVPDTIEATPVSIVETTPEPTPSPSPEPKNRSQTSGREIPEGTPSRPVIMSIENTDGAKPQTGLMQADIIYEFMVESMITRLQVLYNDQYPIYAGPFRSARYYFVDLAQEWDGMYLHLGYGPPGGKYHYSDSEIAEKVGVYPRDGEKAFYGYATAFNRKKGPYNDYEIKNGYRFRTKDRPSPHNLYVMVDKTAQKFYGEHLAAVHERFRFIENAKYENGQKFTTVSLPYMNTDNPNWVQFVYDSSKNRLLRKESGADFMVRTPSADGEALTEEQMNVQNLIVQYVSYGKMPDDDKGRRTCELVGSGKCDYFINGQHVTGTWSRPSLDDFTTYLLDDGSTVMLEPGNTWVAVHPNDVHITIQ